MALKETTNARSKLISADSHVIESSSVWKDQLDPSFWGGADARPDDRGTDPFKRGEEMQVDGIELEVLYPTMGLKLFSIEDAELQEATFHRYNEWIVDYCSADPDRLIAVGLIPCYNVEAGIRELEYCHETGMKGVMVWQTPHPDLLFTSFHYDPLWEKAAAYSLPVSTHILTGFNYSSERRLGGSRLKAIEAYHGSVNEKITCSAETLFSLIFSGVFERFPTLKVVVVENEMSWLPFYVDQWDYYFHRHRQAKPLEDITRPPSEYFSNNVYATFFRDPWAGYLLRRFGQKNMMWSNDFPHGNTTWPKSQEYVAEHLGELSPEVLELVTRQNCLDLYELTAPAG